MTSLYNWARVDPKWEPPKPVVMGEVPDGTLCQAEIARCSFINGDKVVAWRVTSGRYNNCEFNFRVKKDKPMRLGVLLNAVVTDRGERVTLLQANSARVWDELLKGRAATITIGLYQGHNFVAQITNR